MDDVLGGLADRATAIQIRLREAGHWKGSIGASARSMVDRLARLEAELACERGETHKPDGTPWPWTERGWKWLGDCWNRGEIRIYVSHAVVRNVIHARTERGMLPAIEAAEAWLLDHQPPEQ